MASTNVRTDAELIEQGRAIVDVLGKNQWQLGGLALDYAGPPPGGSARLLEYGEAIGVASGDLYDYRRVAHVWPEWQRSSTIPWTCYRDLAADTDRFAVMGKFIEFCTEHNITRNYFRHLQRFRGKQPTLQVTKADMFDQAGQMLERMPEDEVVQILQKAMQDLPSDVLARAWSDPKTRVAIAKAAIIHDNEQAERRERLDAEYPAVQKLNSMSAAIDLEEWVAHMQAEVRRLHREILPRLADLPEAKTDPFFFHRFLNLALEGLDEALVPIRQFVSSGTSDIDSFLRSVLKGTS